ncbi:hypothetical protein C8J46_103437 [Sphingomonas sp. PP-F2F-A104-K0414]|nr:hypothetical protein C8J46_103437 [Sphingomonas sp. PP-F2F-A104-K0414]
MTQLRMLGRACHLPETGHPFIQADDSSFAEQLRDEKDRIKQSMDSETAHSAMAAWLSAPILITLGVIAA